MIYPFSSRLDIMKPCKVDIRKATQVEMLKKAMLNSDYIWEEKLDGISLLSIGGRLYSNVVSKKTGYPSEKTSHMPLVVQDILKAGGLAVFDGEAYLPGYKSNNVTSITNSCVETALVKQSQNQFLQYHVYDILRDVDGTWICNLPFYKRREILENIFKTYFSDSEALVLNKVHDTAIEGTELPQDAFDRIVAAGGEGIVLKDKYGTYQPGKRPMGNQIKVKANIEDDVVVMGFEPATKPYTGKNLANWPYWEDGEPVTSNYALGLIGSVRIGKFNDDAQLILVGRVTGLKDDLRTDMTNNPTEFIGRVMKIKAMEKTENGLFRHANFKEWHEDKNPWECKLED